MPGETVIRTIKDTFEKQKFGVLATFGARYPYTSLVGFISDKECKQIVFATLKNTRKYAYLQGNPQVSILISSSTNNSSDFKDAVAITAFGIAFPAVEDKAVLKEMYLKKFPLLETFINNTDCVLVAIEVEKYICVSHFQNVEEISLK